MEAGLILLNILCYGDIRWLLLEQILLFPCFNVLKRKKREKEKHLYEKGFQNLLQSMMTSLQAGYSLNNSCRIALKELEELYQDQNNPMLRQMRRIIQGLDLHITLEQLFMEFAESTGLEEAKQFAVVIEIVRSTGGNMVEILKRTMQHLKYKMDTEEEIRVLLSGKLFEKNIMLSMPFFILLYLRLANPEYVECFYNTILGHLVMSGMIGITVFCFFWSEKIMNIKDNINKQNKVRHRKRGEQGSPISDKFIQEKELQNRPQMIKTEVDWEAEVDWESGTEGTTILNYGNESEKEDGKICHPMLRDMELGIIYVIKNCPFYIGSAEGVNHLHIQDKTVSREHAVILEDIYEGDGQGYILRDMGSTNGTWLNGKKIKRGNQEQLEDGAVIRFAKKEYEFLIQDI